MNVLQRKKSQNDLIPDGLRYDLPLSSITQRDSPLLKRELYKTRFKYFFRDSKKSLDKEIIYQ